jgi:hypothetical protein
MDTTAVLSGSPISDHRPNPTGGSPLRLVDPSPEDAANVLVEVHARVARVFAAYEAAEGMLGNTGPLAPSAPPWPPMWRLKMSWCSRRCAPSQAATTPS